MRGIGRTLLVAVLAVLGTVAVIGVHDLMELGRKGTAAPDGTPLRERLARVADRRNLRLVHTGRRSGTSYEVTLWFAVDGETLYLSTMDTTRQWVRNVAETPRVELLIGAERFTGTVEAVTGPAEKRHAGRLLEQKYWVMRVMDTALRFVGRDPALDSRRGYFRVRLDPGSALAGPPQVTA